MSRVVDFYTTGSGECPAKAFMGSISPKAAKKMGWIISLVRDLDREPVTYFSKMAGTDQIWECRAAWGSNAYRILAFMDEDKIILTHGFEKKSWKTPIIEIERAERYKNDYFQRKK